MHLVWIRNDLRVDDNPALAQAANQAKKKGEAVAAIFIETPKQWAQHDEAPCKLAFRQAALVDLQKNLNKLGISLCVTSTHWFKQIPKLLSDICQKQKVTHLWLNEELPFDEKQRDISVQSAMEKLGIECHICNANRIVDTDILNQQGKPYKVFTPWFKAWVQHLASAPSTPTSKPKRVGESVEEPSVEFTSLKQDDAFRDDLWPATEKDAHKHLETFIFERSKDYISTRDIPSVNGTSKLSPYLASGLLGAKRCFAWVQQGCGEEGRDWQGDDWLRELAWREFYMYLMHHFPRLSKNRAFKLETEHLVWEENTKGLQAWKDGQTGFPIVDAAMRQLNRTGWMHNRLRMVTASFLTKLLFIDWREGEKYFMQKLIDGDFASNNGGWQWSASTGCDAQPYFRIFNPYSQSKKFDPEGKFIRKMVPELKDLNDKDVHQPPTKVLQHLDYPEPIIDYKFSRERALERFKALPPAQER